MNFIRGNAQAPKGHAFLVARSASNPRTLLCTYCVVPPIPMSIAKYISPFLAAQFPLEESSESPNVTGIPIPPMLEEVESLDYIERLAERRDDDICDIGPINVQDQGARMQLALYQSQEYTQLYTNYISSSVQTPTPAEINEPASLDDLDAEELLLHSMSDRQKLTELGKYVGMARYALEGRDSNQLEETQQKMQHIARLLADKYRTRELVAAAIDPQARGAKLAELYLSRAFKLLDEEYAEIPGIERAIRELQEKQ